MFWNIWDWSSSPFFRKGLAWQAAIKKTTVRLDLLTDINMLLTVEKSTRGELCYAIHQHVKANNKYMKQYDKN